MTSPEAIQSEEAQKKLAKDPCSDALMAALRRPNEKDLEAAAMAYAARAAELAAPAGGWRVNLDLVNNSRYSQGKNWGGPLSAIAQGVNRIKATRVLCEAGANPWLRHYDPQTGVWARSSGDDMAHLIMRNERVPLSSKAALFPAVVASVEASETNVFLKALLANYAACTEKSSKLSAGVLGAKDKEARDAAKLWVDNAEALMEITAMASAEFVDKVRESLGDAAERLSAKNNKTALAVSPAKMKKSITPEEAARIGALSTLLRQFGSDHQLIEAGFAVTDWIEEKSMALAIRIPHHGCLLATAMSNGSLPAMRAIESAGSNIWLAAAQMENDNACAWAISAMNYREDSKDEMFSIVARMLLNGAALNGAENPKDYCIELAQKAVQENSNGPQRYQDRGRELLSRLEAFNLASALESLLPSGEEAPRRRSSL